MQTVSFGLLASAHDAESGTVSMLQYQFSVAAQIDGKTELLPVRVILYMRPLCYEEKYAVLSEHTVEAWHCANAVYAQYGLQLVAW